MVILEKSRFSFNEPFWWTLKYTDTPFHFRIITKTYANSNGLCLGNEKCIIVVARKCRIEIEDRRRGISREFLSAYVSRFDRGRIDFSLQHVLRGAS